MNEEVIEVETYYSKDELKDLGLKKYGTNVKISRHAIIYRPQELEIGSNVRIDDFTTISGKVALGNYIHIAQTCSLFGGEEGIIMEDFSALSSHGMIYATSDDYSGQFLTNPTIPEQFTADISETVVLKKHVVVGCGSVILPGVTIGEGCSVGSMTLCNRPLEPWGIYVGIPAKRLRDRSKHILQLEKEFKKTIGCVD